MSFWYIILGMCIASFFWGVALLAVLAIGEYRDFRDATRNHYFRTGPTILDAVCKTVKGKR